MATRYVTLKDSNGDTIYPQAVVANISDFTGATASTDGDRGLVPTPTAGDEGKFLKGDGTWNEVSSDNIVGGTTGDTLANGALVEVVGTTTGDFNYAWKYADGRLICFQHYTLSGACTTAWGSMYAGVQMVPKNYAVEFSAAPAVSAQLDPAAASGNCWLATGTEQGSATKTHPSGYQLIRPTSYNPLNTQVSIIAYGFWK